MRGALELGATYLQKRWLLVLLFLLFPYPHQWVKLVCTYTEVSWQHRNVTLVMLLFVNRLSLSNILLSNF